MYEYGLYRSWWRDIVIVQSVYCITFHGTIILATQITLLQPMNDGVSHWLYYGINHILHCLTWSMACRDWSWHWHQLYGSRCYDEWSYHHGTAGIITSATHHHVDHIVYHDTQSAQRCQSHNNVLIPWRTTDHTIGSIHTVVYDYAHHS